MSAQDQDYQPKPKVIEHPERDPRQGFDLRTHIKDAKTGDLIRLQPYTLRVVKEGHGSIRYFERPKKSGNLFFEDGKPAGRWENGTVVTGAAHKDAQEMTPQPRTKTAIEIENEALRKELDAIKAQNTAKMEPQEKKATLK